MRYIGQKTKLLDNIECLLEDKGIVSKDLVFCDAFSGTATVGMYFRDKYKNIISNDNLYFSYVLTQAKLNTSPYEKMFKSLDIDPFEYFNSVDVTDFTNGFIYRNYAPTEGKRQFFSDENAKLIDFIRTKIDEWFLDNKITEQERFYLIACLIESVSFVSNVAGVYGAYLKKWDPRALKKMVFRRIEYVNPDNTLAEIHNEDITTFIKKVSGDVLYLDPPYTKTVYTGQYHLLETIAKYDTPTISGKSGLRDMSMYSTSLSKINEAEVVMEELIKNAKFKHIILSYSSDGIISPEFIEALLKRYGKAETFEFKKISYKKYRNAKAKDDDKHQEYLFYIEKKPTNEICYSSPLNYIGGKADLVSWLKSYMPEKIDTFYDLFGGGMNVPVNVQAKQIIYNDINFKVKELLEFIIQTDTKSFLSEISRKIKKYNLEKGNKDAYMKLRENYNNKKASDRSLTDLFLLIMYGFQQQIRFNSKYDYNNPVGNSGFNEKIKEKLVTFASECRTKNIILSSEDYEKYLPFITEKDFVYLDPPYLITLGSYNDGKRGFNGWNETEEKRLLNFLTKLNQKGVKFMLSNVLEHKNKENELLKNFIRENNLNVVYCPDKTRGNRKEIIILNYEPASLDCQIIR